MIVVSAANYHLIIEDLVINTGIAQRSNHHLLQCTMIAGRAIRCISHQTPREDHISRARK